MSEIIITARCTAPLPRQLLEHLAHVVAGIVERSADGYAAVLALNRVLKHEPELRRLNPLIDISGWSQP